MSNLDTNPSIVPVAVGIVVENMSELDKQKPSRGVRNTPQSDDVDRDALRVLITLRRADRVLGGHWELPGGKVEANERAEHAVVRELREEVGIEVRPLRAMSAVDHCYEHAHVRLLPFICQRIAGVARPIDVAEVRWVKLDELSGFRFPEASLPIIASLKEAIDQCISTPG